MKKIIKYIELFLASIVLIPARIFYGAGYSVMLMNTIIRELNRILYENVQD